VALQPVGGGDGNAGSFRIIRQAPSLLVRGVNDVVDAVTVTAMEPTYGIVFEFTRSRSSWEGGAVQAAASFFASNIKALAEYRHVQGIAYTQAASASGNLIDELIVTVGTDDGEQEATFVWPLETVDSQSVYARADAVFAQVMAVANATGA
jgi:uncharacterized protein YheU (UPF0270 family)